jgi:hypothetical protein
MTSVSVTSRSSQGKLFSAASLVRGLGVCSAGFFLLTAAWVLIRRLGGALQEPLSPPVLLLLGGLLGLVLAATFLLERGTRLRVCSAASGRWPVSRVLSTLAAVTLGAAISLPQGSVAALCGFWLLVLVGAVTAWFSVHRSVRRQAARTGSQWNDQTPRQGDATIPAGDAGGVGATGWDGDEEADEEGDSEQQLLPEHVLQRITRARDERGAELIFGTLRCAFVTGQRQQSIHLAFCPPLVALAHFVVDQVDGPAVQLRTVVAQTFGVSLEVKLGSPSRVPVEVQIQFYAFEKSPDGAGA